jgi:ABC-type Mn2+/Zn2+ transport system ATPase subunit
MRAPSSDLPIVFEQASLQAGDVAVLRSVSLVLGSGAPTVLIGPNGAGKTTLIRLAASLTAPTSGRVTWGGKPGTDGQRIAVVFQRPIMLRRSVAANVAYALPRRSRRERRLRTNELLLQVGLAHLADRPARRLSGGEQQRLRIAQALVADPRLLLCDEPLANLDLKHQQGITDLIVRWRRATKGTVLFVTHDVNPILGVVDRVLFVVNGRWAAGTPDEVLTSEKLSELYGSHVDVVRVHDRVLVVGETTGSGFELEEAHHMPETARSGR